MTDNQTETIIINDRYELREKLGEGGMGTVHLAYDRITDDIVALKQVKVSGSTVATGLPEDTQRRIEELRTRLTHEFRILAGMRHPHIISVLDYGFTADGTPFYTMEYLSDADTITDVGKPLDPKSKIQFLIQVLQALEYLHRRGILHRDLKPENILIQDGKVKVLDFGISLMMEQTQDADQAGTVAYMAPEVLTGQAAPSAASDLWAVGIIAFELFGAGIHPFEAESTGRFINNILFQQPDFYDIDASSQLMDIVERLLEKELEDRYQSAQTVINILLTQVGTHIVTETSEIRESFLQTARFTGREDVMEKLSNDLLAAYLDEGKLHLIAGPSGIGKSRVLDELRIKALVSGFNVVRGTTQEEADQPFGLWTPVMRRLCLMTPLTDEQAAVLKLLVPDIGKLLKRDIPDAPDLEDAQAAKRRLFDVTDHLIRAIERPLLILLEDLQWAENSSLDLLAYLARFIPQHNVLIVASYRNDITPDLSKDNFADVPCEETILKRLDDNHIRQLAVSILGAAGERATVVDVLKRESNGNAFFLVETIRALAEHSGQLEQIGVGNLPDKIFPDGIQNIVQRRLSNVNEEQIAILRLAAVGGYELDTDLMEVLTPDTSIEIWLTACANYAILEVEDGLWRFTHRQLRDGLLKEIPEDETISLHYKMAEAKIDFYNDGDAHEASIAYHWEEAKEFTKAGIWYLKAGQIARKSYATPMAIKYYEKAKEYLPGEEEYQAQQMRVAEGLGELYLWQAKNEDAQKNYDFMLRLAQAREDAEAITSALLGLCEVNRNMGQYEEAIKYAVKVQERERESGDLASMEMVTALAHQAFSLNRMREYEEARTISEKALKLATENKMTAQIARLQSTLGVLHFRLGDREKAEEAMKLSLQMAEELGERRNIAIRNNNLGELYRLFGQYENAEKYLQQAIDIYLDIGAHDTWLVTMSNLAGAQNGLKKHEAAEAGIRAILAELDDNPYAWPGMLESAQHLVEALYAQEKYTEAIEVTQEWVDHALEADNKPSAAFAWYYAGNLSRMIGIPFSGKEKDYTVSACFEAASELFARPHPPLLRDWALHEADMGNMERALELKEMVLPLLTDANEVEDIQKLNEVIPT